MEDQGRPEDEPQQEAVAGRAEGAPDWDKPPWPELRRLFGYDSPYGPAKE